MADSSNEMSYPDAATTYWDAGWRGILPFRHKTKWPPPSIKCPAAKREGHLASCPDCTSYTGYAGVDPSYADVMAWGEEFTNGNLGLRMPDGVIGVDVDAYGAKTGAAAFTEAQRRWGALTPGPRSTSRVDDPISGIRLFRVPPGTLLEDAISFPEMSIGDIEIIQRHHRYAMAWPSIHPEGRGYWWLNNDNQVIGIPSPESLPWLPTAWQDALKLTPRVFDLSAEAYNVRDALTAGDPSTPVQTRLQQAIRELNTPGQSRHDTACRHVIALLRLGKNREPGVHYALSLLRDTFIAVCQVDHSRSPEMANSEFGRMITNPNAARELSQPGITDWFRSIIAEELHQPETPVVDAGSTTGVSDEHVLQPDDGETNSSAPRSHLEEIERGFWKSRDSLDIIYTASLARMCSPWSVLAFCVARTLQQVRPNWTLPPIIGGPGSLNWFAAIVDRSGGGKTISKSLARELIPAAIIERNLGSGEGITTAYRKPSAKRDEQGESHDAVHFNVDEVDTLIGLGGRSGSTTMSTVRSAWSGDTLGFQYVSRDIHVEAHSYRMTMIVGVQPERAGTLLDERGGGTPQRFMWFPANDTRITAAARSPWIPGPINLPTMDNYPRQLYVPPEAEELIINERARAAAGDTNALDGHALFCREKFAYALALLDGRIEMNSADWELSGIAADVSTFTREWLVEELRSARDNEAVERGQLRGIESEAAENEKKHQTKMRAERVFRLVLRKIEEAGPEGISLAELNRKIANRDRDLVNPSVSEIWAAGMIGYVSGSQTHIARVLPAN